MKTASVRLLMLSLFYFGAVACGPKNANITWQNGGSNGPSASIPRAEVADQGSGQAFSGHYSMSKVTVGGTYLRRSSASTSGSTLAAGLQGNPRATQ